MPVAVDAQATGGTKPMMHDLRESISLMTSGLTLCGGEALD
jgi:hypothetical protein